RDGAAGHPGADPAAPARRRPDRGRRQGLTFSQEEGAVHPRAKAQRIEMLIGVLGFFTAGALLEGVALWVRGKEALRSALVLLGFVVLLGLAIRWRRRQR